MDPGQINRTRSMVELFGITNQDKEIRIRSKFYSVSIKGGRVAYVIFLQISHSIPAMKLIMFHQNSFAYQ